MSSRSDLIGSLLTFHVRLWLGGLFLAALVPVSLIAALLNFVAGQGPEDGPYGHVHSRAVSFDGWLKTVGTSHGQPPAPSVRDSAPPRRASLRA